MDIMHQEWGHLIYLSCLRAYSSILIRLTRSCFMFSCPFLSPCRNATWAWKYIHAELKFLFKKSEKNITLPHKALMCVRSWNQFFSDTTLKHHCHNYWETTISRGLWNSALIFNFSKASHQCASEANGEKKKKLAAHIQKRSLKKHPSFVCFLSHFPLTSFLRKANKATLPCKERWSLWFLLLIIQEKLFLR